MAWARHAGLPRACVRGAASRFSVGGRTLSSVKKARRSTALYCSREWNHPVLTWLPFNLTLKPPRALDLLLMARSIF